MYFCGNLRLRELTLCFIPSPVYRVINFFTRDRKFCTGSTCSYCGAVVSCLLFPLALIIALFALIVVILLIIAFMPIFLVLVLPFLLITRCRRSDHSLSLLLYISLCRSRGCENVVKITDTENEKQETRREQFLLKEAAQGLATRQGDLVTADFKQDVGTNV